MNVFLTGSTGFIGRNLARRLAEEGHRVTCLVRDPSRAPWIKDHPGLEMVVGDLDNEELLRSCAARSELVYHLAACTSAARSGIYLDVNGHGTGRLAAAVAAAPSGVKLVYVSSLSVAGPRTAAAPAREEDPPAPISIYGRSKLLGEELMREALGRRPWTIVRPPVVYGPYDRDVLFLFRLARRGILLQFLGARTEISLVHVDDLVDALILAGSAGSANGECFYLSDGLVYRNADLIGNFRSLTGRGVRLRVPPLLMRAVGLVGDISSRITGRPALLHGGRVREALAPGWVCDISKIRSVLGYRPLIGIEEGFRGTYGWYREQGWI